MLGLPTAWTELPATWDVGKRPYVATLSNNMVDRDDTVTITVTREAFTDLDKIHNDWCLKIVPVVEVSEYVLQNVHHFDFAQSATTTGDRDVCALPNTASTDSTADHHDEAS